MLKDLLLLGLIPAMVVVGLHVWASTPVVHFSWSTQQCVEVVFGEGTCDNLPEKFERVWVK